MINKLKKMKLKKKKEIEKGESGRKITRTSKSYLNPQNNFKRQKIIFLKINFVTSDVLLVVYLKIYALCIICIY